MKRLRQSIDNDQVEEFLKEFLMGIFGAVDEIPEWVIEAINYIGYKIE